MSKPFQIQSNTATRAAPERVIKKSGEIPSINDPPGLPFLGGMREPDFSPDQLLLAIQKMIDTSNEKLLGAVDAKMGELEKNLDAKMDAKMDVLEKKLDEAQIRPAVACRFLNFPRFSHSLEARSITTLLDLVFGEVPDAYLHQVEATLAHVLAPIHDLVHLAPFFGLKSWRSKTLEVDLFGTRSWSDSGKIFHVRLEF